jgi:hypothetical protein
VVGKEDIYYVRLQGFVPALAFTTGLEEITVLSLREETKPAQRVGELLPVAREGRIGRVATCPALEAWLVTFSLR